MSQQEVRDLFLEEFVKRMIIKSLPRAPQVTRRDGLFDKMDKVSATPPVLKIKAKVEETLPRLTKVFFGEEIKEKPQEIRLIKLEPAPAALGAYREIGVVKTLPKPAQQLSPRTIEIGGQKPAASPPAPASVFDRLKQFITDPMVSLINCPGPGKNILITRFGVIQQIPIALGTDEIRSFLKDLSEKTKIPLLTGIFKVVYQNILVTAVVSEYVGTKFVIEKKPAAPLPLPIAGQQPQPPRMQFR
jgi:hypothetical protein